MYTHLLLKTQTLETRGQRKRELHQKALGLILRKE